MLPLYLVSRLASQHVKVVLSGDGADELLAGYPTYVADQLARGYQKLPGVLKNHWIPGIVNRLPVCEEKISFEFKAKRFIHGARLSPEKAHYSWRIIFSENDKRNLLKKEVLDQEHKDSFWTYERFYESTTSWDSLSRHQYADMKVWLVDSILAKVDFMSMAHSLEVRVPFLNPTLVQFIASLPPEYKLNNLKGKYILRKAMQDCLPAPILKRKKAGFNIPIGQWLRSELKDFMTDVLTKERIQNAGYFNWSYIQTLIDQHLKRKKDHGFKLLSLLHFSLWHDKFVRLQD